MTSEPAHATVVRAATRSNTTVLTDELRSIQAILEGSNEDKHLLDEIRGLSAPIRRIPPEIFTKIFQNLTESLFNQLLSVVSHGLPKPLAALANRQLMTLAHVCMRWFRIVVSTPALWSNITIDVRLWQGWQSKSIATQLLQSVLHRSGTRPLTILIYSYESDAIATQPLSLLTQHAARWEGVAVVGTLALNSWAYLAQTGTPLPLLRKLYVTKPPTRIPSPFPFAVGYSGPTLRPMDKTTFPALRELIFPAPFSNFITNDLVAQLTMYVLTVTLAAQFPTALDCIVASSSKASFTLQCAIPRRGTEFPEVASRSSEVDHLHLVLAATLDWDATVTSAPMLAYIFNALTLPSLRALAFSRESPIRGSTSDRSFAWPQAAFLSLVERSGLASSLCILSLMGVKFPGAEGRAELIGVLKALPALRELALGDQLEYSIEGDTQHSLGEAWTYILVDDELLSALTLGGDGADLLPELHTLTLLLLGQNQITLPALLRLVKSRTRTDPIFACEAVALRWKRFVPPPLPADVIQEFKAMNERGEADIRIRGLEPMEAGEIDVGGLQGDGDVIITEF
ncbi:Short chain dehydrogenase [Mycena kentingensis (nom. inval.)]|nr:Short chain dehydrogenase [Mycena kentingensis (nom. inval.)]